MSSHQENGRSAFVVSPSVWLCARLAVLLVVLLTVWPATATLGQSESPAPQQSQPQTPAQNQAPPPTQTPSQTSQPSTQSTLQTVPGDKPQSLAEAARQANAQKNKPKAKRVYTGDDLGDIHGNISVVGDHSSRNSTDNDDSEADTSASPSSQRNNSETYWRSRARSIKDQIASTDQQIADLKAEMAKAGPASFDTSTGLAQGIIYVHDRNADLKQLEERKTSLERQLDELADEARKAGADSGWTR